MENRNLSFKTAFKKFLVENNSDPNEKHPSSDDDPKAKESEVDEKQAQKNDTELASNAIKSGDIKFMYPPLPKEDEILEAPLQTGHEPQLSRRLIVTDFDLETSEDDLVCYFKRWGEISECFIMKDEKQKSKGFGFVTFMLSQSINDALSVQYHKINGRNLILELEGEPEYLRKVLIKYLHPDTSEASLMCFFKRFGEVQSSVIMRERNNRKSRCLGYVIFKQAHSVAVVEAAPLFRIDNSLVGTFTFSKRDCEPENFRKLYISNLNYETAEDIVIYYFEQFAKVESCFIDREDIIGKSLGSGYIILMHAYMVDNVLAAGPHKIDYRKIILSDTKPSAVKKMQNTKSKKWENSNDFHCEKMRSKGSNFNYVNEKIQSKSGYNLNDFDGSGVNIFKKKPIKYDSWKYNVSKPEYTRGIIANDSVSNKISPQSTVALEPEEVWEFDNESRFVYLDH